jgi:hypothetical protein
MPKFIKNKFIANIRFDNVAQMRTVNLAVAPTVQKVGLQMSHFMLCRYIFN